jgi:hypothetical protein
MRADSVGSRLSSDERRGPTCHRAAGWTASASSASPPAGTSTVAAPMRRANWRSASGGMASSFAATQVPRPQRPPGRDAHHVVERRHAQRLLNGVHDPGLHRIDARREVVDEVLLREPAQALVVDDQVRQRRRGGSTAEQGPERLALVESERRDEDETDDVRCVAAERRDDLAAIGMAGEHARAVQAREYLPESRDVVGERGLRELRSRDVVALGLQPIDDGAPG